jgi:UDP-N-acetylmuramyl tripeptide synthase
MMGAVAAKLAHSIVLTTDNTRGEDPVEIAMQIKRGIPRPLRRSVAWELDRRMAVRLALQQASPHDVVLICGRGAETEQEVDGRILARSDMEIVQEAIKTG